MDDCISRQAAIDDIRTMVPKDAQLDIQWIEMWLKQLPSAQPQRMRGRWIESNLVPSRKGKPDGRLFICSECNKGWVKQDRSMKGINYCPNCGADMRGRQNG